MNSNRIVRALALLAVTCSVAPAQWLSATPVSSPPARWGAAMDFVPTSGGLLMFGGVQGGLSNDTWRYDGVNWLKLIPPTSPSPRFGGQIVFDWSRGVAVYYGGLDSPFSVPPPTNETWEWDGATWSQVLVAGPGPLYRYGGCYDSVNNRVVLYGGTDTQLLSIPSDRTWQYNGTAWTQIATTGSPGPRDRMAMCFHEGIGKAVLFGGSDGVGALNDTWLYDGTTSTWTQVATSGPVPSVRQGATMAYDPVHQVCVLSGGSVGTSLLTDTWTFDGLTWREQVVQALPVRDTSMAFLPGNNRMVRFGGLVTPPVGSTDQTLEFGSGTYGVGCAGSNGTPELTTVGPIVAGSDWTMTVENLDLNTNVALFVIGVTRVPGVDLTPLGLTGCQAYTSPDFFGTVVGMNGTASLVWPAVMGPLGASVFCQVLSLDATANPFGFSASNGLYSVVRL